MISLANINWLYEGVIILGFIGFATVSQSPPDAANNTSSKEKPKRRKKEKPKYPRLVELLMEIPKTVIRLIVTYLWPIVQVFAVAIWYTVSAPIINFFANLTRLEFLLCLIILLLTLILVISIQEKVNKK